MKLTDDPCVVHLATASGGDAQLTCARCSAAFAPSNLDEASRGVCGKCLSPSSWAEAEGKTRRSIVFEERARPFTPADKSLIARVHGYMPALQLLKVLNERLCADLGEDAPPYTAEQLHTEIHTLQRPSTPASGWANVRTRLAEARREGVLQRVSEQTIDDFAVVFSLTAKQVLHMKDVLLSGGRK